jgi:hypothetical protein
MGFMTCGASSLSRKALPWASNNASSYTIFACNAAHHQTHNSLSQLRTCKLPDGKLN